MRKRILSVLIGFGLCQSGVWGNGKVESPSVVELRPFSGKDVELEASWIKQREDLDVAYLQSVEADRLLHNFRVTAGLPSLAKPLEGWESRAEGAFHGALPVGIVGIGREIWGRVGFPTVGVYGG